jgi:hypothetical protein
MAIDKEDIKIENTHILVQKQNGTRALILTLQASYKYTYH